MRALVLISAAWLFFPGGLLATNSAHAGPHVEGVPLLGIIGFAVAGTLGVAWAVLALRSGTL